MNAQPSSLTFGPSRPQLVDALLWPAFGLAMAALIGGAAWLGEGRWPALIPSIMMWFFGLSAVLLVVLELRELGPRIVEWDADAITLRAPRTEPLVLPWRDVIEVQVLAAVTGRSLRPARVRVGVEVTLTRDGARANRLAPQAYQAVDLPDREAMTMMIGEGMGRVTSADERFSAAKLPKYRGVRQAQIAGGRRRFGREIGEALGRHA